MYCATHLQVYVCKMVKFFIVLKKYKVTVEAQLYSPFYKISEV